MEEEAAAKGPVLPDLVTEGLEVVFVGTAAGTASAEAGHYYSGPQNSFYSDLYKSGLVTRLLRPKEDGHLLQYGVGVTDLAKTVASGSDAALGGDDFDTSRLAAVIDQASPKIVCFNGKNAYQAWGGADFAGWGLQPGVALSGVPVFVVPSTSGRVPAEQTLGGRTRLGWFTALREWLSSGPVAPPATDSTQRGTAAPGGQTASIVEEISRVFQSDGKAPYLTGDGFLTFVRNTGRDLVVLRQGGNPRLWEVPLWALESAVDASCRLGRPLHAGECNDICNRRGTPLSILLRLVPEARYAEGRGS